MRRPLVLLSFLAAACGGRGQPSSTTPSAGAEAGLAELRGRVTADLRAWRPNEAMSTGLHEYDGKLGDRSPAALAEATVRFRADREALDRAAAGDLSARGRLEIGALRGAVSAQLFDVEALHAPMRSPFHYLRQLNLIDYVSRDYAPLADRARAVIRYTASARTFLGQARANLASGPIPRPWVEIGILISGGAVEFVKGDARKALLDAPGIEDEALRRDLAAALDAHAADLTAFREYLISRRADAGGEFALGPELYLRMLAETEGVTVDLATLERVAAEDTARNLAALDAAARQLDPRKTTAEVVALVLSDIPPVDKLLEVGRAQVDEARAFVASHPIAAIPSDENAVVALSPPYMRANPAFLESAGPFEKKALPSYYFISPPDPSWPPEQQRTYVPARPMLAFITVHEVWPGHFLQDLYLQKNPSEVLRSFCSYAFTEGWAHYAEEMTWDAGFGAGDPKLHIGQLQQALMRDARFLASLGLHTKGMSVDEATRLFQEKALLGAASARQQAVRGTVDPMYLSYTLGKLMIKKLRDDWMAKQGPGATLKAFHEALLSTGCQPLPVMRQALVGGGDLL